MTLLMVGATPAANCSLHWVAAHMGVERQARRNKTMVRLRDMRESIAYRGRKLMTACQLRLRLSEIAVRLYFSSTLLMIGG